MVHYVVRIVQLPCNLPYIIIIASLVPRPLPVSNVARKKLKREGLGREITCAILRVEGW